MAPQRGAQCSDLECSFIVPYGTPGTSHAEVLLQKYKVLGCDVIGLKKTRRPGQTEFAAAGHHVFCSGEDASSGWAGQYGVVLAAVKESIIREATWTQELTNERLVSFNLVGKSDAITFVVEYGLTDNMSTTRERENAFWVDLDCIVSRVPSSDYLHVIVDSNARTDARLGEENRKVVGAYGRDTRVSDSNGTSLLWFVGDNKLAQVNTFFFVPKGCTSCAFNGTGPADQKLLDYIITPATPPKACPKYHCPLAAAYRFRPQHRVRNNSRTPRQIRS